MQKLQVNSGSSPGPPNRPELHNLSTFLRLKLLIAVSYLPRLQALFSPICFICCCPNLIMVPSPKTLSQQPSEWSPTAPHSLQNNVQTLQLPCSTFILLSALVTYLYCPWLHPKWVIGTMPSHSPAFIYILLWPQPPSQVCMATLPILSELSQMLLPPGSTPRLPSPKQCLQPLTSEHFISMSLMAP